MRSVVGKGSTFYVELPVAGPQREGGESGVRPVVERRGKRILVVDDEPHIVESLERILRKEGYSVEVARDGEEAWEAIQRDTYDCVIMDLRMPGTGGKELYRRVEERDLGLARRVVFVTGDILNEETRGFIEGTGNGWLEKPFSLEELERRIQACVAAGP